MTNDNYLKQEHQECSPVQVNQIGLREFYYFGTHYHVKTLILICEKRITH